MTWPLCIYASLFFDELNASGSQHNMGISKYMACGMPVTMWIRWCDLKEDVPWLVAIKMGTLLGMCCEKPE